MWTGTYITNNNNFFLQKSKSVLVIFPSPGMILQPPIKVGHADLSHWTFSEQNNMYIDYDCLSK